MDKPNASKTVQILDASNAHYKAPLFARNASQSRIASPVLLNISRFLITVATPNRKFVLDWELSTTIQRVRPAKIRIALGVHNKVLALYAILLKAA